MLETPSTFALQIAEVKLTLVVKSFVRLLHRSCEKVRKRVRNQVVAIVFVVKWSDLAF